MFPAARSGGVGVLQGTEDKERLSGILYFPDVSFELGGGESCQTAPGKKVPL